MKTILVVDSDPIMLHTLVGLLKSQSSFLNVLAASNLKAETVIQGCGVTG